MPHHHPPAAFALFLLTAAGCSNHPPAGAAALKAERLEAYSLGSAPNVHALNGILFAGQPSEDDLALARDIGVKTVVNLRDPRELDWDEAARVQELGMEYRNIAIQSPASLGDETFGEIRALLRDASRRPMLLHCASANRVGAVWLAHRVLDDKASYEAALQEARTIGLRNPEFEAKATKYIERQRK